MRPRMFLLALPLILLSAAAVLPQEEDKVTLKWKFKKGQTLRYEQETISVIDVAGLEIEQEMLYGLQQKITRVDAKGVASMRVTYDRVKVRMEGMMESDYDSEKDEEPPEDMIGRLMAAFLGKSFTMKINPYGNILKLKGIVKIMEEAMGELEEEEGAEMMGEMMKEMFRDNQMKDMMNLAYPTLPKKAVGEDDTWESEAEFNLPLMGGFTLKTTSTLKEIRKGGKEAVIKMDTKIEREDPDEEEDPFGGMLDLGDTEFKSTVIWLVDISGLHNSILEIDPDEQKHAGN